MTAPTTEGPGYPLDVLRSFDRLEVGPVKVEKRRITMPYTVCAPGGDAAFELVYRYEEDVLDPQDQTDVALASMVGAQVALNYGLFCDEIVFRGPFDETDGRFLDEMAKNTAREIYVKKFLEPNPFLVGPAASLPVVRRDSYLRARLSFPDLPSRRRRRVRPDVWDSSSGRVAILSSGGKDSLLSYGLFREAGFETHALYVNESGRHWFTALNAYRAFAAGMPGTGRVWTNADRLFSWMLRRLPFVRPDFAEQRSDEYPVRLWTVAVFLFGALPLLKGRGIGRLVIGDEFDTTRRCVHEGIPHFDGLYDQSFHFDDALSAYFHRKGWNVSQFSVLRPLSEFLIQKILTERYPDLQALQVSCHAAHKEGDRVHPCGRCEKCRRIVGMLVALGADPTRCGYRPEHVKPCLEAFAKQGVAQDAETASEVVALLREAGHLGTVPAGKRFPEVMQLRFDSRHAPRDGTPTDVRRPLWRLCLEHAAGAVKRRGRVWVDCDPLVDPSFLRPYRFGEGSRRAPAGGPASSSEAPAGSGGGYLLGELTWPQAERRLKEVDVAILPVGAIEQHGPHLPLDTDAFDADYLARAVAEGCSEPKPLVLPAVPYGVSYHHDSFAGTISVNPETLSKMVYDIGMSLAHHGVTKLVIINGHGGNGPALQFAAQNINRDAHIFTCVDSGETSDVDIEKIIETNNDVHAGEIETSTSLAVRGHLVDMTLARKFVPSFSSRYLDFTNSRSVEWFARIARISPEGVLGDPTRASREKGEAIWEIMIRHLVAFVEDLKSMTLDEIYERRY